VTRVSTGAEPEVFTRYLERTRWFGGKGRPFEIESVRRVGELPRSGTDAPWVVIDLVEVVYVDGPGGRDVYQVPLALYTDPESRLDHAFLGWWEDPAHGWVHAYDALHDREAMALWLRAFDTAAGEPGGNLNDAGGLRFHRIGGHQLDLGAHSTLFSGEQSNSSVAYGEDALMKVFRKITPGVNPDISVHDVLTRAGSDHVAALYGWLDWVDEEADSGSGTTVQLAMLQQFLRTASDGWDLALASVRDLFAEADLHADEVGGDFASEAHRLGAATAEVHASLASGFPTAVWDAPELANLARLMGARLDEALPVVPELAEHEAALRRAFDAVATLGETVTVQRVHGDYHLGQTLRTVRGWKIVDFEGEPAKPLEERIRNDSPWRDVAGMLRSFDYAAHAVEADVDADDDARAQIAFRAAEWARRNQRAYLDGYTEARGRGGNGGGALTPAELVLLRAYQADKAVYETVYETRNRPTWLDIPLGAVARLAEEETA
jgi:maltokinase